MSDIVDRFKKRQETLKELQNSKNIYVVPDKKLVNKFLTSEIDIDQINQVNQAFCYYDVTFNVDVSSKEVEQLIKSLRDEFNEEKFHILLDSCRHEVIKAIVTPLGLGKIVAHYDKNGGNVDTIHNVRKGIYVSSEEESKYNNLEEYNTQVYHSHPKYIEKNKTDAIKQKNGKLIDGYTGRKLTTKSKRDLDHIISAKEIHDDPGRILAELDGAELANSETNLVSTERVINRAKKAKNTEEFLKYLKDGRIERQKRIKELSKKSTLTIKEKKELEKLQKLECVNKKRMIELDRKARETYNKTINYTYYTSSKFIKRSIKTSNIEGCKMGFQQAIGFLTVEFFDSVFDILIDLYKQGYSITDQKFINYLKTELLKIKDQILSKWKEVLDHFKNGFISAFISNLITIVINAFITTGKRLVRIIREGFLSLLQALKMLCFPPEGMTLLQAAHEATKLMATTLITIGAFLIENSINNIIISIPILKPISDILTSAIDAAITGIGITIVIYTIDQIDIFKVNKKGELNYIMNKLDCKLKELFNNCNLLAEELKEELNY